MSIFEPIPRESRLGDGTHEFDDAAWDDEPPNTGGSFDPRSIKIAGLVVSGIVVAGLVVSNMAEPEPRSRPAVASRVDPGAAAVEQTEVKQGAPTAGPSASPSVEPADQADSGDDAEDSGDDFSSSRDPKGDDKPDKPGRGRGHDRD